MELPKVYYEKASFMETTSGNIISRQSLICGSQNMIFGGKTVVMPECIFRGDLANIRVGRYCIFLNRTVVRPPFKKFSKGVAFFPLTIGDHVFIEEDCVINAASIGSFVHIGKGAIIGRRCVLKDYCAVAAGAVLPPETVVPSYSLFGGDPGHFEEELPECTEAMMKQASVGYYKNLIASNKVEGAQ